MKIKLNQNALRQLQNDAVRQAAANLQPELDRLSNDCNGLPVEAAKSKLKAMYRRHDMKASEAQLDAGAAALSRGERIEARPQLS